MQSPSLQICIVAAFFLGMGAVALARPSRIVGYFDIEGLTRNGRNEVRAVYGGFGLAIALLLMLTPSLPEMRSGAIITIAVALLGMALGRLISAAFDGLPGLFPCLFFAVELALAGLLVLAL